MKIVHLKSSGKKPSEKQILRGLAERWVMQQRAANSKKAMKLFEKEIEEIRRFNPGFLVGRQVQL